MVGPHDFIRRRAARGERCRQVVYLNVNPVFDPPRADGRFRDLFRRLGLAAASAAADLVRQIFTSARKRWSL